jgi:hypothetical protein
MRDFGSIGAFAEFLETRIPAAEIAGHDGVRLAAEIVQTEARAEIGIYQGEAGPFAAWAELAEETKAERVRLGFSENDPELRTGTLRDSIEVTASGHEAAIGVADREVGDGSRENPVRNIGLVAEVQELGHGVPPRSFLGAAAFRKQDWVVNTIAGHVAHALAGLPPSNRPPGEPPEN